MDYSCTNFITKLLNHEIGYFSIKKIDKTRKENKLKTPRLTKGI